MWCKACAWNLFLADALAVFEQLAHVETATTWADLARGLPQIQVTEQP